MEQDILNNYKLVIVYIGNNIDY